MMQITDRLENIQDRLACGNCIIRGELMGQRTGRLSSRWSITQHVHAATRLAASWRMHACIEVIEAAAPIRFHRGPSGAAGRRSMRRDVRRSTPARSFYAVLSCDHRTRSACDGHAPPNAPYVTFLHTVCTPALLQGPVRPDSCHAAAHACCWC
jgi:hypothetical protein